MPNSNKIPYYKSESQITEYSNTIYTNTFTQGSVAYLTIHVLINKLFNQLESEN